MITFKQLWAPRKNNRLPKFHKCRTPSLRHCPHKRGVVTNVVIVKPKKPNSARRHIANIVLSTKKKIRAAVPGEYLTAKHSNLKQHSKVLIRGGRTRDIIGIRYKIILGVMDADPLYHRKTSRSKYGVKHKSDR